MTREEAIKLLVNATYSDEWQGNEDLTTAHNMAIKALEQEQKSGKWINKDFRKEEYVLVGKCSVCGQVRVIDKFCSHCGVKMESEE